VTSTENYVVIDPTHVDDEDGTLAQRLVEILRRINEGRRLRTRDLSQELGVAPRTIQRDLKRFRDLGLIEREGVDHRSKPEAVGRLSLEKVRRFADRSGVDGLFPGLTDLTLRELMDSDRDPATRVQSPAYEDLDALKPDFEQLQNAIREHCSIDFVYAKTEGEQVVHKRYSRVRPYRLINHGGVWYLGSVNAQGELRAFTFSKISRLLVLHDDTFAPDPAVTAELDREDSIWLNRHKIEVVLRVAPLAAGYFQRRKLVPQQKIEKEMSDGALIVSGRVAHADQILPLVRTWIPHVRFIHPESLQVQLNEQLLEYLKGGV